MPLPQDVLARQQDAIFRVLGEDATWSNIDGTVRVERREADESIRTDYSELVDTGRSIKVRKSEVPAPAIGDQVQILDATGNPVTDDGLFEVSGEPKLDRRQVWTCPVKTVAP
jgi:hypothetical protein